MPSPLIRVMVQAAERAGRALVRDFGEVEHLQVSRKGPSDFVSRADMTAERIIHGYLEKARPGWGFLMEESGAIGDQKTRFIVDPLDGTTNFLHAIPHFAVSIAAEEDGHLQAGVIFDPVKDELFYGERGSGAFLNNHRIRTSGRDSLSDALLAVYLPVRGRGADSIKDKQRILAQLAVLMSQSAGVRRAGSAALDLAYVASGRLDGFWEKGLCIWDVAAGILLVKEAGGFVSHSSGEKVFRSTVEKMELMASNNALHQALLEILQGLEVHL